MRHWSGRQDVAGELRRRAVHTRLRAHRDQHYQKQRSGGFSYSAWQLPRSSYPYPTSSLCIFCIATSVCIAARSRLVLLDRDAGRCHVVNSDALKRRRWHQSVIKLQRPMHVILAARRSPPGQGCGRAPLSISYEPSYRSSLPVNLS